MFSVAGNDLPLIVNQLYSALLWPAWVTPSHPLRPSGNFVKSTRTRSPSSTQSSGPGTWPL